MDKKVTVLTPCYNGENHIHRYFDALLKQTYDNFEIIFVDDGSKDNTAKIVKKYIKKFKERNVVLKYLYQENSGQASAINNGLKHVTGDYLVWPDSDDYYENDALEILASELDKDENIAYVKGNPIFRKEENLEIINIPKPIDKEKDNFFEDYLFCTPNVCSFAGIVMIKFDKFKKANKGLDIYNSRGGQNWQLLLPITYHYRGKYIDKNIYNCVVRENSHSHSIKGFKKEIKRTFQLNEIIDNVLKKINMPKKIRNRYLILAHKKYFIERLRLIKRRVKEIIFNR